MRINKYLAAAGVASRRECDKLISEGKVAVNGKIASLGLEVGLDDEVAVNGNKVVLKKNEYYILNNPRVISVRFRMIKAEKPLWT